ncbi:MGMT family protein [Nocardioides sp. YIM 152315]|uniref:MGMT family protein n=1 Tax=Nocardioides sp. YIM 152315 TaxID=3031760 RepID=UPI0023D9CB24|nr:MGMT family protein [Nocardioides sp. YIM 152315]MDF1604855.1 MGMT family protein [Nocardioides sp. YIM 152315]
MTPTPPPVRTTTALIDEVAGVVASIPSGRVASYGDIGDHLGVGARQVGRIMGLLTAGAPWWRVVHADGSPATCHDGRAPALLEAEGVPLRRGRVDMSAARVTTWSDHE